MEDGYRKVPSRLLRAGLRDQRHKLSKMEAALYFLERASFTECEIEPGLTLQPGETPPFSFSGLATAWRWSAKEVRGFLVFLAGERAATEWGITVKQGRPWKVGRHNDQGHRSGHSTGHRSGHTYVVRIKRLSDDEGHSTGHRSGHRTGQTVVSKKGSKKGSKTDMGHGMARVRHDYPTEFEMIWKETPRRVGNNPKVAAYRAYAARVKEGANPAELLASVKRYAAFCDATHLTDTPHTMQVATFFGPNRCFEQDWEIPHSNGNGNGRRPW